jgi:hypothetical protein
VVWLQAVGVCVGTVCAKGKHLEKRIKMLKPCFSSPTLANTHVYCREMAVQISLGFLLISSPFNLAPLAQKHFFCLTEFLRVCNSAECGRAITPFSGSALSSMVTDSFLFFGRRSAMVPSEVDPFAMLTSVSKSLLRTPWGTIHTSYRRVGKSHGRASKVGAHELKIAEV